MIECPLSAKSGHSSRLFSHKVTRINDASITEDVICLFPSNFYPTYLFNFRNIFTFGSINVNQNMKLK